jgi:hypothetical protein
MRTKKSLLEAESKPSCLASVIEDFNIDKMKRIVPYYIVDMGEVHCNELRFIIETFLSQNHDFKEKVDELKKKS